MLARSISVITTFIVLTLVLSTISNNIYTLFKAS